MFYSALAYKSHQYSGALAIKPEVSYIMYGTSSHKQAGKIITFEKFEEINLVENESNGAEEESI